MKSIGEFVIAPVLDHRTDLQSRNDHPLALYIFSSDKSEIQEGEFCTLPALSWPLRLSSRPTDDKKKVLDNTNSGGVTINDVILHAGFPGAPFGGVGGSGHGYYHGPYGFQTFSHLRTIVSPPKWFDRLLAFRYPPYSAQNKANMPKTKVTFKRDETIQDQRVKRTRFLGLKFAVGLVLFGILIYSSAHLTERLPMFSR